MTTIKAVDKLRKNLREWVGTDRWETLGTQAEFDALADEIEAETAEMKAFCERVANAAIARDELEVFGTAYMPLPLDADGAPIRVGDKLIAYNERVDVEGVGDGIVIYRTENDELCLMFNPAAAIHVKPRTLEDVLFEFGEEFEGEMNEIAPVIAKYAEEIRELLGVDDD